MKKRVRVILFLVRTVARIQGLAMRLSRRLRGPARPPARPERHLIVLPGGPMPAFMHAGFWPDKIIENYGVVGQPTPREQSPAGHRENIFDRIEELLEEGYVHLRDFDGAGALTLPLPPDLAAVENLLADRGLGLVTEVTGTDITVLSPAPDLAGPLLTAFAAAQAEKRSDNN